MFAALHRLWGQLRGPNSNGPAVNSGQAIVHAYIDTNVILECLPLQDLPWHDISSAGEIFVYATPTLLREVDSKKSSGRLAERARAFNRVIAPIAQGGAPVVISQGPPRVTLATSKVAKVDWKKWSDLDPGEGDARLIADVLSSTDVPNGEKVVVSQDIRPLLLAQRFGLRTIHVSDDWLLRPDTSEAEKEIARLKKQVIMFQKAEPDFEMNFKVDVDPLQAFDIKPLEEPELRRFIQKILVKNPRKSRDDEDILAHHFNFDYSYDSNYEKYSTKTIPKYMASFHERLSMYFGQSRFIFSISNIAEVTASNLIVEVQVIGGRINEKPIVVRPYGPSPPLPRPGYTMPDIPSFAERFPRQPERHEVVVKGLDRSDWFKLECQDFRHGRLWEIQGWLWLFPPFDKDAKVVIRVTAENLHGKKEKVVPLAKTVRHTGVFDLIEESTLVYKENAHIHALIQEAFTKRNFESIEWDK